MKDNARILIKELNKILFDYFQNSDLDLNEIQFCIDYANKTFMHESLKGPIR